MTAPEMTEEEIEAGKSMAMVAWLGGLVGFPLFIIPLIQGDNAFSYFHAKHAMTTFLATLLLAVVFGVIYVVTCGLGVLLFPLMLLPLIPTIDGIIKASSGRAEGPIGLGGLTDSLFGSMQITRKDD